MTGKAITSLFSLTLAEMECFPQVQKVGPHATPETCHRCSCWRPLQRPVHSPRTEVQTWLELPATPPPHRLLRSRRITLPGLFYCMRALQYSWPPLYAQSVFLFYTFKNLHSKKRSAGCPRLPQSHPAGTVRSGNL